MCTHAWLSHAASGGPSPRSYARRPPRVSPRRGPSPRARLRSSLAKQSSEPFQTGRPSSLQVPRERGQQCRDFSFLGGGRTVGRTLLGTLLSQQRVALEGRQWELGGGTGSPRSGETAWRRGAVPRRPHARSSRIPGAEKRRGGVCSTRSLRAGRRAWPRGHCLRFSPGPLGQGEAARDRDRGGSEP